MFYQQFLLASENVTVFKYCNVSFLFYILIHILLQFTRQIGGLEYCVPGWWIGELHQDIVASNRRIATSQHMENIVISERVL